MKIFLSWSGNQSLALARAFNEWLPSVLQSVKPFLSTEDIQAGEKWLERLNTVLEDHEFGIVCLTKTNLTAPYVMFESGALAKKLGKSRLVPVLCDLSERELVKNPLTQFQYVHLDKESLRKLIVSINSQLGDRAIGSEQLNTTFEMWWPTLEKKIEAIVAAPDAEKKKKVDMDEAIEEMLSILRRLARSNAEVQDEFDDFVGIKPILIFENGDKAVGFLEAKRKMDRIRQEFQLDPARLDAYFRRKERSNDDQKAPPSGKPDQKKKSE